MDESNVENNSPIESNCSSPSNVSQSVNTNPNNCQLIQPKTFFRNIFQSKKI
jgi:hypothetical protein